ncbi:MAG: nucleoside deaminase [Chlorobi bacterium]|nr:nucleoside deaminase [Chlorobiota bacterium]
MKDRDEYYMREALKEARKALSAGEMPVGAVVVCGERIVARAHNQTELLNDATAHAEMIALTAAMSYLNAKYLPDCTLYVTLEPCSMCSGAVYWSKLGRLVYGASDMQRGYEHLHCPLHPKTRVRSGVLAEEAAKLIKDFFKDKR